MSPTTITHRPRPVLADRLADGGLWLLAGLHVLLALSFLIIATFLTPAQAQTQDLPTCSGGDLLAKFEKDDPAEFAKVRAEADATPNGKGIFWKIEKEGKPASYLLGTMHLTDPRVVAMPEGAQKAYAEAKTVIVESDEITDEKKAGAILLTRPDLTTFLDGRSITDFVDDKEKQELTDGLKRRGVAFAAIARMKPWTLMSFVALPACELARKQAGVAFLDQQLAKQTLADGKTLKGLETLIEQISALDSLPIEPQIQGLIQTLALGDTLNDAIATMTDLYLKGDIGMIMPMMRAAMPSAEGEEDAYADFEQKIIIDRNHIMANRAARILEEGSVLMAVGALHLPGAEGVVELLRKQGFTVTAVK